jgi:hypothetical protein
MAMFMARLLEGEEQVEHVRLRNDDGREIVGGESNDCARAMIGFEFLPRLSFASPEMQTSPSTLQLLYHGHDSIAREM